MNQITNDTYTSFITKLKGRIYESRQMVALSLNREMILFYHQLGTEILTSQQKQGWGTKIIEQVSKDLRSEFPDMKGFSPQNLKYMKKFAEVYPINTIGQQLLTKLPWGHIIAILYQTNSSKEREFYIQKSIENGWSRNVLSMQIETRLYKRQGKAITNFQTRLPSPQSDLAQSIFKNPYVFDFLSLGTEAHEREIEKGLISHIEKFLLELGEGFAFLGRQYHMQVEDQDFYIDLLFVTIHGVEPIDNLCNTMIHIHIN